MGSGHTAGPMLGSAGARSGARRLALAVTLLVWAAPNLCAAQPSHRPLVLVAVLDNQTINPASARFLIRAIELAEERQAACLVIELDTPGGLVDSTREIAKRILDSAIPVVVYVSPSGARAASAGLFITLAAHVAAMSPGTNIGAAHPVQVGGSPVTPQSPAEPSSEDRAPADAPPTTSSPAEDKALRDTVAWARALAEVRGRNADWAARAVEESASVTASEAVDLGVVDLVAPDLSELLKRLDGEDVAVARGRVHLSLSNPVVDTLEMAWGDRVLSAIANPNVAFLLLMFGFYGILLELYTPGWGVGGTVGVICLVLAFFALAVLPVNYVGLILMAIGLALFVAEAFVTSYGFLALGGVASMTMGALMLVESPVGFLRVSPWLIAPVAVASALITVFLVGQVLRAARQPALTGSEALVSERALADETFTLQDGSYAGTVRTHGELWRAVSRHPVSAGQRVAVEGRDGLTLRVEPLPETPGR